MRFAAVINSEASSLKTADLNLLAETLADRFSQNGHTITLGFYKGAQMPRALAQAVASDEADAVLAAGGDGTISMAAGAVQSTDKMLAVLPGGNMNLFARSLAIPLDLDAAIEALATGRPKKADIAFANDRPFIHEFSLGLHPEMIEMRDRQRYGSRLGKLVGGMRSLSQAILRPQKVRVWLEDGQDEARPIAAAALAISNNPYGDGHLPYADRIDGGELGVYIAHTLNPADLAAMAARISTGAWADMPQMEVFTTKTLRLTRRRPMKLAIDGELANMRGPIDIRIAAGALTVIAPDKDHAAHGQ